MQAVINAQILEQLDRIGKRLDKIESKDCKKTADKTKIKKSKSKEQKKVSDQISLPQVKPSVQQVGQPSPVSDEALLQLKVDQRLQELQNQVQHLNLNHKEVDILMFWLNKGSNGLMSMFCQV